MNNHWNSDPYKISEELLSYCKSNVSLIIATLNEEKTIAYIVKASQELCKEVIIIDGHSTDATKEIAKQNGALVFLDNGHGKGDAIRVGISKATYETLVFIDADMSHNPNDIPKLVAPIFFNKADHVVGSRPKGGSDELHGDLNKFIRMIGSDIITLGINYRFNVRLTDSQNGFRAMRLSVARDLDLRENITTIEQELTIKTLKYNYKMEEVPIHEYARLYGDSRINLVNVSFRYIYSWLKYLFF
jgi:dolichol-phosphate mannosyltransferase